MQSLELVESLHLSSTSLAIEQSLQSISLHIYVALYSNSILFYNLSYSEVESTLVLASIFMDSLRRTALQLVDNLLYCQRVESIAHHFLNHFIHFIRFFVGVSIRNNLI